MVLRTHQSTRWHAVLFRQLQHISRWHAKGIHNHLDRMGKSNIENIRRTLLSEHAAAGTDPIVINISGIDVVTGENTCGKIFQVIRHHGSQFIR